MQPHLKSGLPVFVLIVRLSVAAGNVWEFDGSAALILLGVEVQSVAT
jgi:hypothetical protein